MTLSFVNFQDTIARDGHQSMTFIGGKCKPLAGFESFKSNGLIKGDEKRVGF